MKKFKEFTEENSADEGFSAETYATADKILEEIEAKVLKGKYKYTKMNSHTDSQSSFYFQLKFGKDTVALMIKDSGW